jgi:hypothetical protein
LDCLSSLEARGLTVVLWQTVSATRNPDCGEFEEACSLAVVLGQTATADRIERPRMYCAFAFPWPAVVIAVLLLWTGAGTIIGVIRLKQRTKADESPPLPYPHGEGAASRSSTR